jgi:hypothetical protein
VLRFLGFFLVQLAFEPGDFIDLRGIARPRGVDLGATQRDDEQEFFQSRKAKVDRPLHSLPAVAGAMLKIAASPPV